MRPDRARCVFITGASSGIGAALARCYAQRGAVTGLAARRKEPLRTLAAGLPAAATVYAVDVRDGAAIARAARSFIVRHGCPDIVIANAGVSVGTLTEAVEDGPSLQEVFDINVLGMANTFRPFIGPMLEAGAGTLVGVASVAGYRGLPGAGAYSASKAAAILYLESMRVELRGRGVDVVTICPGYVDTPMTQGNPYRMPFLMSAEAAAEKVVSIVARGRTFAVIPWQMAVIARVLRVLPNWAYDRLFHNAPRKPRGTRAP